MAFWNAELFALMSAVDFLCLKHKRGGGDSQFADHSISMILDDAREYIVKADLRLVADQCAYLRYVGNAPHHIFEAFFISFVVRLESYLRIRLDCSPDFVRKFQHRDFVIAAYVVNLADGARVFSDSDERIHHVRNVRETARLRAVAKDRNVLACERLLNEVRNDHSVAPRLSGADCVEQAGNHS